MEAEAPSRKRRRKNLTKDYKAAVLQALKFFEKEAQEGVKVPLQQSQLRTALCLDVGERSVQRVALEARRNGGVVQDQGAGGTRARRLKQEHITLIRALLRRQLLRGARVSIRRLESMLRREGFSFSASTVRRAMTDAGFEFGQGASSQETVHEQLEVIAARAAYVRQRLSNRAASAPAAPRVPEVFISERYCSVTASGKVQWLDPHAPLAASRAGSRRRMCMIAAAYVRAAPDGSGGVEGGLVSGSLAAWSGKPAGQTSSAAADGSDGGGWGPLTAGAFEAWLRGVCDECSRVLGPCHVVMDTLPWHRRALDDPTQVDVPHLRAWMSSHGVPSHGSCPSLAELLIAFRREREVRGTFAAADIAGRCGHTVAFVPARHGELMPLECAWRGAAEGTYQRAFTSTADLEAALRSGMEEWFRHPSRWLAAVATSRRVEDSFARFDDVIAGRDAQAAKGGGGEAEGGSGGDGGEEEEDVDDDDDEGDEGVHGDQGQSGADGAAGSAGTEERAGSGAQRRRRRRRRQAATSRLSAASSPGECEVDVVRLAAEAAKAMDALAATQRGGNTAAAAWPEHAGADAAAAAAASTVPLAVQREPSAQAAAAAAAAVAAMARSAAAQSGAPGAAEAERAVAATAGPADGVQVSQEAGVARVAGAGSRSLLPTAAKDSVGS